MKQKKLMLLGGLRYLKPVIEAAHKLGLYVITCDYIPDNIAHEYSDEYHNVSILDKESILSLAKKLEIDGIMSFAVDPGVVTAAYVQEQMGLPGNPYESVCILQNKDRFRKFLQDNGFNCPWSYSFSSIEEAMDKAVEFSWPAIVKPTDAAGSKGVTRVDAIAELEKAVKYALEHSFSGKIIIEEFIEKKGCSSDTDSFSVDGELRFVSFSSQLFDEKAANPYTPAAYAWPSTYTEAQEKELRLELQRLISLLHMRTSIYNIETRVGTNGKPYIMEVSPRGGGNRLSEMLRYATGVDLITNAVKAAVGLPTSDLEQRPYNGYWMEIILHADKDGKFEDVEVMPLAANNVVELDLWVSKGDMVKAFDGANQAIGTLILRYDTQREANDAQKQLCNLVNVKIN